MGSDPTTLAGTLGPGRYRFGGVLVDTAAHTVTRDGQAQALEPKAFAVLVQLLAHSGELVGRDQLLDAVWGHRHVTPGVLTRAIAQLRTALDDDPHHPRFIQTRHALGYRFIGEIEQETPAVETDPPPAPAATAMDAAGTGAPATASDVRPYAGAERRRDRRSLATRWLLSGLLLLALLAWGGWPRQAPPPLPAEASIAVLPFTTLSDHRGDHYFAEGLAAEMHSALSGTQGLRVAAWIAPEAVDRSLDIKALGQRLGVATLLDASVRRDGERIRISARLSDTSSGYTLWSRTYERDTGAIFETQSDIAHEVATALVGVLPDAGAGLRKRLSPTRNLAAFDAYLRGLQVLMKPGYDSRAAIGYFKQALAYDAGFARAQAGICRAEAWRHSTHRSAGALENAQLACLRAANMDPTIGAVQMALGDLYLAKGNPGKAREHFRLAEGDPSTRVAALLGHGRAHFEMGENDASFASYRKALELEPENDYALASLGYQYFLAGKHLKALESLEQATRLKPGNAHYWNMLGAVQMTVGNNAAAAVAFEKSLAIEPLAFVIGNLGTLRYQAGDYAGAAAMYRRAIELNPGDPQPWANLGAALAADPATAAQARQPFEEAARRTQDYLDSKDGGAQTGDAKTLAMLGWLRANLGESAAAIALVRRSEAMGGEPAEVALYNAETFALLGDLEQARARLAAARQAGVSENRIATNAVFRRTRLVASDPAADRAPSPQPGAATAPSPGD